MPDIPSFSPRSAHPPTRSLRTDRVHRHLPGGMEVYLEEQRFAPVFCIYICVKAGSIDESPSEIGMAHVLEHMLFKGSERYPEPGAIAAVVERAGGEINAYTTFDRTVYELSAPSSFAFEGTELLLDMVFSALLDAAELKRELEVIVEEIKRGLDNPATRLSRATLAAIFHGTECGRPVIGSEETVRSFTRDTVQAFYDRWYIPNNMTLVACGDFDAQSLWARLEQLAYRKEPGNVPPRARPIVSSWNASGGLRRVVAQSGPFQEVRLQLAVRAPALEEDALARWDALMSLLGQGDSSRLARRVKDEEQLVTSIDAGIYAPRYPVGMASLSFYTAGPSALEALVASLDEIATLSREVPSESEVRRIHTALKAERIYARESVEGVVRQSLANLLTSRGLDFEDHYVHALSRVTPRTIQETAREFVEHVQAGAFALSAVTSNELEATISEASLAKTVASWCAPKAHTAARPKSLENSDTPIRTSEVKTSSRSPDVRQIVISGPGGLTMHVNYRRTDKIPACAMGLYALGGQQLETPHFAPGCASLLAQMLTRGTQKRDYRSFVTDLEDRAASLQAFQGRDSFGIRADALAQDFEHVLSLMFETVFQPAFAASEFERVKRESIEAVRAQKDSPGARLGRLSGPIMYGDHAYARPLSGTEESLAATQLSGSEQSVVALWRRNIAARRWIFSVAGDFDEDALAVTLAELMAEHLLKVTETAQGHELRSSAPPVMQAQVAFEVFEREQAHILLGFRGVSVKDESRTALEVAASILSGQGGRLFGDLREKLSLAYSVSASQTVALAGGHFASYIATTSDKAQTAFAGLKRHLEELALRPPSAAEVEQAQQSLLGGQALDSQSLSYQCSQLAFSDLYGLGFDNFLGFRERVLAVTPERVTQAMRHCMQLCPPVAVVVGPRGTWVPEAQTLSWHLHGVF